MSAFALLLLVLCQIYLGAMVAGMRAGLVFNTWPLIDGALRAEPHRGCSSMQPVWRNFFENALTVQFDHRMVAYALWIGAIAHAIHARRTVRGAPLAGALTLAAAVTLQVALGITALLYQAPLALALLHQATGIVVLTVAVVHAEQLSVRTDSARVPARAALSSS